MKKLSVAASFACVVALSQASTVSWGITQGQLLDATKVDAGKMYMCYTADEASINWNAVASMAKITEDSLATIGFEKVIANFDYSASKVNGSSSLTPTGTGMGTDAHNYYYVAIDDGGEWLAYSGPKSMSFKATTMALTASVGASTFNYAQAAPEPTSGLMLLLGVGLMALRRRRV